MRERHVLANGHPEHEPLRFAVLRDEGNARGDRCADSSGPQHFSIDENFAAIECIRARDRAQDLGPSRADQTGESDDFAGANGKTDAVHDASAPQIREPPD